MKTIISKKHIIFFVWIFVANIYGLNALSQPCNNTNPNVNCNQLPKPCDSLFLGGLDKLQLATENYIYNGVFDTAHCFIKCIECNSAKDVYLTNYLKGLYYFYLYKNGNGDSTRTYLNKSLNDHENTNALNLLARTYLDTNYYKPLNKEAALPLLSRSYKLNWKQSSVVQSLIDLHESKGDSAFTPYLVFRDTINLYEDSLLIARENLDDALIQKFEAKLKYYNEINGLNYEYAIVNFKQAASFYEALETIDTDAEINLRYALLGLKINELMEKPDYSISIQQFNKYGEKLNHPSPRFYFLRGKTYKEQGFLKAAEVDLKKACSMFNNPDSMLYKDDGKPEKPIDPTKLNIEIQITYWKEYAGILVSLNDIKQAIFAYEKILTLDSTRDDRPYLMIGYFADSLGLFNKKVDIFERAVKNLVNLEMKRYFISWKSNYDSQKDTIQKLEDFIGNINNAVEISEDANYTNHEIDTLYYSVMWELAKRYFSVDNLAASSSLLNKLSTIFPRQDSIPLLLGQISFFKKEYNLTVSSSRKSKHILKTEDDFILKGSGKEGQEKLKRAISKYKKARNRIENKIATETNLRNQQLLNEKSKEIARLISENYYKLRKYKKGYHYRKLSEA